MSPFNASPLCLDDVFSSLLARRQAQGILRQLSSTPAPVSAPGTTTTTGTPAPARPRLVDFSSNDYLSLSRNPSVLRDYLSRLQDAIDSSSSSSFGLGSGGSRLLDGDSPRAAALERHLAAFHHSAAALLFNSGFEANTGLLACVPRAGDAVVLDELVHASAHAGVRLSRAAGVAGRVVQFAHNAVWEEEEEEEEDNDGDGKEAGERETRKKTLDGVLRRLTSGEAGRAAREGRAHVFVAVEAVYSMDGDVAPLLDVVRCVERRLPLGNGHVVVDEAHSNGLFGDRGRGLVCQLGLEERVWARVNTFGKAMGCSGGNYGFFFFLPPLVLLLFIYIYIYLLVRISAVVLCSPVTRAYLINYARTFIYTTAMGSPALLSIQVAYDFVASDRADAERRKLQGLIRHLGARLARICSSSSSSQQDDDAPPPPNNRIIITINNNNNDSPQSPIIPIFTTRARSLAEHCQERGYMVRAIVAPTVPRGTDRVRICLHAGNSVDECDGLCDAIEEWVAGAGQVVVPPGSRHTAAPPPPPPVDGQGIIRHRL